MQIKTSQKFKKEYFRKITIYTTDNKKIKINFKCKKSIDFIIAELSKLGFNLYYTDAFFYSFINDTNGFEAMLVRNVNLV